MRVQPAALKMANKSPEPILVQKRVLQKYLISNWLNSTFE